MRHKSPNVHFIGSVWSITQSVCRFFSFRFWNLRGKRLEILCWNRWVKQIKFKYSVVKTKIWGLLIFFSSNFGRAHTEKKIWCPVRLWSFLWSLNTCLSFAENGMKKIDKVTELSTKTCEKTKYFEFNMAAMEAYALHVGIRRFYTLCIIVLGQLRRDHVTQTAVRDYVDARTFKLLNIYHILQKEM